MIKPVSNYLLVKPAIKNTETASGFVVATAAEKIAARGEVIALGEGVECVGIGEEIVFKGYAHEEVEEEGVAYYLVPEDSVLGKII